LAVRNAFWAVGLLVVAACGGRSEERRDDGSGGTGASGGKGGTGADGGSAFTGGTGSGATGGTGSGAEGGSVFTGGTGSGATGGSIGGTGATGGTGCCLAFPACPAGEVQISGPEECPPELPGSACHTVTACCSTIWCATDNQCEAFPSCDPGDATFFEPCPPIDTCYSRSLCGSTVWCIEGGVAGGGGFGGFGGFAGTGTAGGGGIAGSGMGGIGGAAGAPCNPDAEHNRHYIGLGDQCLLIDFACTGPTMGFYNECGCGCEQDGDCPQVFDCSGNSDFPCTPENLARCPFSGVPVP
jgi:hypothetical protein